MRWLLAVGSAVVGLLAGVASVLIHAHVWGLGLALVTVILTAVALGQGPARLTFAAAWGAVVLRGSLQRPEGDFLVASNPAGWTLIAAAFALFIWGLVGVRGPGGGPTEREDPKDLGPAT